MSRESRIVYIGSFPPPYGGVTVKNALLYKHLSSRIGIEVIDLSKAKKLDPKTICRLAGCLVSRKGALVLGVSADWRRRLTGFLYLFNRKKMRRSYLFVMGGKVPNDLDYVARMGTYKHMYVETESMRKLFEERGAHNVSVYPNCRERPKIPVTIKKCGGGVMNSVFFSLISPDKGVRIILESAKATPQVSFHFYGRIEDGFAEEFLGAVANLENATYHGVFDSVRGDVIGELSQYDIHLFPTLCPNEGVPGVLVETKMAGVPTVASDRAMNAELVADGVDGVLTREDSAEELSGILAHLAELPETVDRMKESALRSAEAYYIDRYLDWLLADLVA